MKKILVLGIVLLGIFLIYLSTLDKKVYFLSLGDEISQGINLYNKKDYNYNDYIKEYLENKKVLETYINLYFNDNMRTIDLIDYIEENKEIVVEGKKKTIKNALIKADLVTLSIGSNDVVSKLLLKNNYTKEELYNYLDEYLKDIENLFKLMRQYCKEDIVFIGYYNIFNDDTYNEYFEYLNKKVKKISNNYEINFVDIMNDIKNNKISRTLGELLMNENELNLKDKLRDFYEHKKKETFLYVQQ